MTAILKANPLSRFNCLCERCEDTCCQGWSMQVDRVTLARYQSDAPELMNAVEQTEDAAWIMRKDPATTLCVKLENGLCGVHKQYGADFLSDACYFYPRVTRKLGEQVVMTAAMSCPEITRLSLFDTQPYTLETGDAERLPNGMKDYLPEGMSAEDALGIHRAFLNAAEDESASAEQIFLRVLSASHSLERIDKNSWLQAAPHYLAHADARLPAAEMNINDPFNLLHALCGLIVASRKTPSPRLQHTIQDMERAMGVTLDWSKVEIVATADTLPAYQKTQALWEGQGAAIYAPVLRRWLQMQLGLALYPFAGFGGSLAERTSIIGVRLATIKLALMCAFSIHGAELPQDVVVRVIQSLSRFMDHLGNAEFSLQIYVETGWTGDSRMRGLLGIR